ncbi:MAG TPA: SDR family NAD(P)-dependent oxidoreductase [Casimicrobiaceae bacterium]|jgi:NAD(P)-dependent dehydrogenase (short-subunit alcohol dehydrogenase family)
MTPNALSGQHAVVTGGGRGIGLAIAHRLGSLGASLSLIGRDRARLYDAVQSLPDGTKCDAHVCDVADAAAVARAFAAIATAGHRVSILVNNAGIARSARLAATDDAMWAETIGASLSGTFHCTRAALPALLEARAGRVVNVASTAGLVGYPNVAAYVAAKHGVVGLTRALALELASSGVTVNAVCPGYADTDIAREAVASIVARTGRSEADARSALASRNPQKRLIAPVEVASAVAWLCLPESRSVNGQVIVIDGGETAA